MATPAVLALRSALNEDRSRLANLLHFETYVHRHLDWRRPLDWLGKEPYLVAEHSGELVAALACPPDPPGVSWIRLFAASRKPGREAAWKLLWGAAQEQLSESSEVVAIPLHDWFSDLLAESQFEHIDDVVVLDWQESYGFGSPNQKEKRAAIREMRSEDLLAVHAVDHAGFPPLWHHSLDTIQLAFNQAAVATVIELEHDIVAYQISTLSSQGLHLARLAVHPNWQGRHLALSLVENLQEHIIREDVPRLTVNTQQSNEPSLGLYKKAGFRLTGEAFPVYHFAT